MKKITIEIKWALIFALAVLVWMLLEKLFGLHDKHIDLHYYLTNLFAIPAIWIYVLALKDKKRNFYNGQISYKAGVVSGTIMTLIITLLYPILQWIISEVITPDYFTNVINYSLETGYHATREEAEAYFNLKSYIVGGLIWALIIGIATTLIVMLFLRSKKS